MTNEDKHIKNVVGWIKVFDFKNLTDRGVIHVLLKVLHFFFKKFQSSGLGKKPTWKNEPDQTKKEL